jgi:hypothetical protein
MGGQLRQAKVQDLGLTPIGDKNVSRLDVAMDDTFLVGRVQPIGDLDGNVQQFIDL